MNKISEKILQELSYYSGKFLVKPNRVVLMITFRCNFKCSTCDIWKGKNNQELSKKSWLKVADQLIKNLPKEAFIEISGGEPLLKRDQTIELIKKLKRHFQTVALNTNGSTITPKTIKLLEKAKLDQIKVSFYSTKRSIHNQIRGTKIAYNSAIRAIEYLEKSKIKTKIGVLITAKNIKSIPETIKFLSKIKNCIITMQPIDEKVESFESKKKGHHPIKNLWPKKSDVIKLFNEIKIYKKHLSKFVIISEILKEYYLNPKSALKYRCFVGQKNLVIYPNGDLSFCFKKPKIGNIIENKLDNLLKNAKTDRKNIKKCKKYCRVLGCNFNKGVLEVFK
jgi:MoaA/NifB/PqqE/SkfB family radical SAM enzyme